MTTTRARASRPAPSARRKRDAARTKEAILQGAMKEFCSHGFTGARVDRIAKRSRSNMRMIYHYFGNKAGLYLAVLERVYEEIRSRERTLQLGNLGPVQGMAKLIDFTFSFFGDHTDFIALINNENLLRAKYLKQSKTVRVLTMPLVDAIEDLLRRGSAQGVFREGVDPVQLYVSIVAQSYFHVSNRCTLSAIFGQDLGAAEWLDARRIQARELILSYLADGPRQVRVLAGKEIPRGLRSGGGPAPRRVLGSS